MYARHGKPNSINQFLLKFVQELQDLISSGVEIENQHYKVQIKLFSCDTPATCYLKCIVGHMALNGCERCRVVGEKVNSITAFLGVDSARKIDEDINIFITFSDYFVIFLNDKCLKKLIFEEKCWGCYLLSPNYMWYLNCFIWNDFQFVSFQNNN